MISPTCSNCIYVDRFTPRVDERARYGFGNTGWGCRKRGWEGYCPDPSLPPCGGQHFAAKAMEARKGRDGEAGSVHDSAVGVADLPETGSPISDDGEKG